MPLSAPAWEGPGAGIGTLLALALARRPLLDWAPGEGFETSPSKRGGPEPLLRYQVETQTQVHET